MKKFLASVLAVASAAALFGASANPFFSASQFQAAAEADGLPLVTFPLVYKGSLKMTGMLAAANEMAGCAVFRNSFSVPLYMTMCQPCIEQYPCDFIPGFKDGLADSSKNLTVQSSVYLPNHPATSVSLLEGSSEPGKFNAAITSWNLYAVISYQDIAKIFKKNPRANARQLSRFSLSRIVDAKAGIVMKEDLLKHATEDRGFFTGTASGDASVYWWNGAPGEGWEYLYSEGNSTDDHKFNTGGTLLLTGRKAYYNFSAVPGEFSDSIKGEGKYGWYRIGNDKTVNHKIMCVKTFKGYAGINYEDDYQDDGKDGEGFLVGGGLSYYTIKLTLNSLTKTVANRIFGGYQTSSLTDSQPTICEEGLATFSAINEIDDSCNVFENAAFGKKIGEKLFIKEVFTKRKDNGDSLAGGVIPDLYMAYFAGNFEFLNIADPE